MKKLLIVPVFILFLLLFSSLGQGAYGDIAGKVSEFSWSFPAVIDYAVKPDSIRLGNSEYYLIVSGFGVPTYCVAKTVKVWNNNGTIKKTVISSLDIDLTTTDYTKVLHVSGNIYAVVYFKNLRNRIKTFYVWENNGTIRGINSSKDLTTLGEHIDFTRVNNTNTFIVTYTRDALLGKRVLQYDRITINNDGSFGATMTNKVVNALQGMYPRVVFLNGTADKILVSYYRNSTTDNKIMLETWNVTSNVRIDRWEAASFGYYPVCRYIKNNIYVLAYQDSSGYGQIYSFELYKTGVFPYKSFIEGGQFTSGKGGRFNTVFKASLTDNTGSSGNVYGITYQDNSSKGNITTLSISNAGGFGLLKSTFKYNNSASSYLCPVQYVSGNFYLLTYEASAHGISCVVNISTDLRKWQLADNSFNGQFRNTRFKLLDNSFNGQFRNTMMRLLDNSFNGQFRNTGFKLLDNSFNGQFRNTMMRLLDDSFNGQFRNTGFKLLDNSFNGQFRNTMMRLLDDSFNGQFRNTRFMLLDNDYNGSFISPVSWRLSDNSFNGSFVSIPVWRLADNGFNGSFRSISINITGGIIISNENPLNNSVIDYYFDNDTFYISFDINRTVLTWYNVSVFFDGVLVHVSNHSINASFLVDVYGNYSHELYYDMTYNWSVRANTSDGNTTSAWFVFNTGTEVFAASLAFDNGQFVIVMILNLFGIIFSWGYWSKKRSGGFLMIFAGFLLIAFGVLIGLGFIPYAGLLMVPFGIFIIVLGAKKAFYGPETEESQGDKPTK